MDTERLEGVETNYSRFDSGSCIAVDNGRDIRCRVWKLEIVVDINCGILYDEMGKNQSCLSDTVCRSSWCDILLTDMWNDRNILMIGEEKEARLQQSRVLVVGVGGVGAYAAEMIVRAGVGNIVIVDSDVVSETNINRQLLALHSTIGRRKVDVLEERLLDINPNLNVEVVGEYLKDERTNEVLAMGHYDCVIDAIDTLAPKVFLLYQAHVMGIPTVSCMGSGGKMNPMMVKTDDISRSNHCKLARMVRKRLHHLGVTDGIRAVYSDEVVDRGVIEHTEGERNKVSNVGTLGYMTAVFGCFVAGETINQILQYDKG